MKVAIVLGTRPEIIKNYAVVKALRKRNVEFEVIHTNQHHDYAMQGAIFEQMGYYPDRVLEGKYDIGKAIDWVRELVRTQNIDLLLANGDTAAALVAAIAAVYSDVGLAHIEAGLRSFDKAMYEERNRIMVDAAAHYLFAYTDYQAAYLDGIPDLRGRVFLVGNTTVDLLVDFDKQLFKPNINNYAYVTLHRKEFTDSKALMISVFETLNLLETKFSHIIFPMHPRTYDAMKRFNISSTLLDLVQVIKPVPPLKSLSYEKHAEIILTDSGCVQEEAYLFNVPCVTLRENTERHETILNNANVVSGFARNDILQAVEMQLAQKGKVFPPIYGSYGVGERIVDILCNHFENFRQY